MPWLFSIALTALALLAAPLLSAGARAQAWMAEFDDADPQEVAPFLIGMAQYLDLECRLFAIDAAAARRLRAEMTALAGPVSDASFAASVAMGQASARETMDGQDEIEICHFALEAFVMKDGYLPGLMVPVRLK